MSEQDFNAKLDTLLQGTVEYISPDRLNSLLPEKEVVVLDTRMPEEYAVSHIPGAQFLDYSRYKEIDVRRIHTSDTVIVYCSVGYRSEKVGEFLLNKGYSHVYNLYGGIFKWKNEGYPVINLENEETERVHTYNKKWSVWLENGIKVYD